MLTRRKKQNLLYLGIGVAIGIAITALVAYFGVIYRFTKDNIVKIYDVLPGSDTTKIVLEHAILYKEKQVEKESNQTLSDTSVNKKTEGIEIKDSASKEVSITIKTDIKIAEAIVPIVYFMRDSLSDAEPIAVQKGELRVEHWENPTNFAGYRKTQNKLIVYGIDIDNIELELIDDNLYLIFNNKKMLLKDSDSFLRYPSGFLR